MLRPTAADLAELAARGIAPAEAERQLALLADPPERLHIERPCTVGDGIERIAPGRHEVLAAAHDRAALAGRWTRFVPASGAATRMFQSLLAVRAGESPTRASLERAAAGGSPDARATLETLDGLERFAFHDALEAALARQGASIASCRAAGDVRTVLDTLLDAGGFELAACPKGLLAFHRDGGTPRTAFEEQLREALVLGRDAGGRSRTHFTVSPEHEAGFTTLLERLRPALEGDAGLWLDNAFSCQKPSTDTVALGDDGEPFRIDGRLLFRPAGHGALIENLADLGSDLVSIKNIDNVQPVSRRGPTLRWARVLGGRLLELESRLHAWLERLDDTSDASAPAEAMRFVTETFGDAPGGEAGAGSDARAAARARLHRPLRVCGMVPNTGEPGGGPFWVRGRGGALTRQIVESAEIDPGRPGQREVFERGTHFNPVFLVCALRDHRGAPYPLADSIDPDAVIVTRKSAGGRPLRALERPGLWNGAMARWLTVFVEVPAEVFTPVKTLNDLLRPEHQP